MKVSFYSFMIYAIIAIKHVFIIHYHSLTFARSLGFQHFPLDLANVNEWEIRFDPSINLSFYPDPRGARWPGG